MASKKPSARSNDAERKEDVKQAVIVDYRAIGCECPGGSSDKKPFIQYSLEWLLIEQFHEVFVCCLPDNVTQMREFVKSFIRNENVPPSMTIQVHASETNLSTGDCLRDLDSKALIKSDFVIMDVGCCGNLPLAELLDEHKRLKKVDKNAILTSIVRNLFTRNPTDVGHFPIYITDPKNGHLLYYVAGRVSSEENETPESSVSPNKSIDIPSDIFLELDSVKIHTNVCSTNLSIYSANVPVLYAELFDCHSEADLIQAAFDNHEVLGGSVYIHVVDDLFSQRMADFGFAINQKRDKFDTNLIYRRNERCQVLRKLVNDSLIGCTKLNTYDYLLNLPDDEDSPIESESESEESVMEDDEAFLCEVLDSLVRGFEETIKNENLVLEVNSSKHAYNISIDDVYSTIAKAILLLPDKLTANVPKTVTEYANTIKNSIETFRLFLLNYMKSDEAKDTVLSSMEELYLGKEIKFLNDIVLAKTFYSLYEVDAVDEDSILRWYQNFNDESKDQKELRAKPAIKQLVETLEAESDEDEEEDDEE